MSADDGEPLPRLGRLPAVLDALGLVRIALGLDEDNVDVERIEELFGEQDLVDLVASLSNLSALLVKMVVGYRRRVDGVATVTRSELLDLIREDQFIHDARSDLSSLDDGMPW